MLRIAVSRGWAPVTQHLCVFYDLAAAAAAAAWT